ncbi:MAG TPA: hypothetical protein VFE62_28080, partial [Gemmataceae bacterium]|nr:hypothetical protein [Gemmataceae bacterium]
MTQALWLAGMLFASLWTDGGGRMAVLRDVQKSPEVKGEVPALQPFPLAPIHAKLVLCCDQPPSKAEVLRALPTLPPSVPYAYEQYRDEVEVIVEKLVDRVNEPQFYPLVGPAKLHHCHWKCTVYFNDVVEMSYPFAFKAKTRRAEVVYLDKD